MWQVHHWMLVGRQNVAHFFLTVVSGTTSHLRSTWAVRNFSSSYAAKGVQVTQRRSFLPLPAGVSVDHVHIYIPNLIYSMTTDRIMSPAFFVETGVCPRFVQRERQVLGVGVGRERHALVCSTKCCRLYGLAYKTGASQRCNESIVSRA